MLLFLILAIILNKCYAKQFEDGKTAHVHFQPNCNPFLMVTIEDLYVLCEISPIFRHSTCTNLEELISCIQFKLVKQLGNILM